MPPEVLDLAWREKQYRFARRTARSRFGDGVASHGRAVRQEPPSRRTALKKVEGTRLVEQRAPAPSANATAGSSVPPVAAIVSKPPFAVWFARPVG